MVITSTLIKGKFHPMKVDILKCEQVILLSHCFAAGMTKCLDPNGAGYYGLHSLLDTLFRYLGTWYYRA